MTGNSYIGSNYYAIVLGKWIKIGCEIRTVAEWLKVTKTQAANRGLSEKHYLEYREFVKLVKKVRAAE